MKKRLVLSALAMLLVAGATLWATNDRDKPRTEPAQAAVAPPAPPQGGGGGAPGGPPGAGGPGAFPQPPGGAGFGGQPPGAGGGFPGGGAGGFKGGAKIDYKELIPTLISALEDDDGDVRKAVAQTLAHIGQP